MEKIKLGQLVEFQRGYDLTKKNANLGKYKVVTSNGIMTTHNDYKSGPSVVIGRSGTVGRPQLINENFWPHNTTLFVKDFKGNDLKYIYYLLLNLNIDKFKSGSNIPTLNRNHLHPLTILATENLSVQKKIAFVLNSIDEKIKNNIEINNILSEMIGLVYQKWFVEFDFIDENGRPYQSSGGKMVYNENIKKQIPEGWKVENLYKNSISKIIKNGVKEFDKKIYLETANINNEFIIGGEEISYGSRPSRANMQPKINSIWFAKMKNTIKHLVFTEVSSSSVNKFILSTGMYGVECEKNVLPYIYSFINSEYFELTKNKLAHGATQEAVNDNDVKNIKLIIPKDEVLKNYSNKIYNMIELKNKVQEDNQELEELRDYLLPMLINGQINVDNVQISNKGEN